MVLNLCTVSFLPYSQLSPWLKNRVIEYRHLRQFFVPAVHYIAVVLLRFLAPHLTGVNVVLSHKFSRHPTSTASCLHTTLYKCSGIRECVRVCVDNDYSAPMQHHNLRYHGWEGGHVFLMCDIIAPCVTS